MPLLFNYLNDIYKKNQDILQQLDRKLKPNAVSIVLGVIMVILVLFK